MSYPAELGRPAFGGTFVFTPTPNLMVYVYILKSKKDGNMYVGSTRHLEERLSEHNSGQVFSTRLRIPFELVYYEAYASEHDARMRESRLKLRSKAFAQLKKRIRGCLA